MAYILSLQGTLMEEQSLISIFNDLNLKQLLQNVFIQTFNNFSVLLTFMYN